jgi:pimeloyl-ACP methyl ester carboxylesterase
LAVWGRNDPFFLPAGAEAFRRDNPEAVVRLLDTGHFALETHAREVAAHIHDFLGGIGPGSPGATRVNSSVAHHPKRDAP